MPEMAKPRPGFTGTTADDLTNWMNQQGTDYAVPNGWTRSPDGQITRDQPNFLLRHPELFPIAGVGAGLGLAAAGVGAPAAAASGGVEAGATSGLGSTALPGAGTSLSGAAGASGGSSMAGSLLKGLVPDGKTLLLSLLSMFGDNGQQRQSFREPGQMTDPKQALQQTLNGIYRLGQGVTEMGPVKLRSSYVQAPPSPVTIPGLPFQIGGGMGRDPALTDPSLLEGQGNPFKYDPFQSLSQAGSNGNPPSTAPGTPGVRRRNP